MTIVKGSIRSQGENDALPVTLNVIDRTLILRTGTTDLGQWAISAVTIRHTAGNAFDFIAEGDHLIFEPDDPNALLATGIATDGQPRQRASRKRRRNKQQPTATAVAPPPAPRAAPAESPPRKDTPRVPRQPRERRETRRGLADRTSQGLRKKMSERQASRDATDASDSRLRETFREKRHQAWIFALDQARRIDLFGLDRVPFKDHMRNDPNHEHTWDHRVAPESGLANHICVICGKIRW